MTTTLTQMSYEIEQLDDQDVTRTVMVMAPNDLDHDERGAMADLLEDVRTRLLADDVTPWAVHPG